MKVREVWEECMPQLFSTTMYNAREDAIAEAGVENIKDCRDFPPAWLSREIWNKLIDVWETSEWQKKSKIATNNRLGSNQGFGVVIHIGGTAPTARHEELLVGHGTYSNVYKARDRDIGKIVALKKVSFDTSESESVKFMAREIMILQKLDHPNVLKLEGLATSRMQYSLYLVFDFMHSDLARVISRSGGKLTEPQVKCYMLQLLAGLQHCHERGILHRDIKGSNLLIDKNGMLKIGDFGLANHFNPNQRRPLTSRVVTLWYKAPELLLGATDYGVGIDLWSAGCLLAEMFAAPNYAWPDKG